MARRKTWAPVPALKPGKTTAYKLLNHVCKLILEEPRRYNQGQWLLNFRYYANPTEAQAQLHRKKRIPDCGTIGCVAGWVTTLGDPKDLLPSLSIESKARSILGIDYGQGLDLFAPTAVRGVAGSLVHARSGVKHIRQFMRANKTQLQQKTVEV